MRAGELDRRVKILRNIPTTNAFNEPEPNWTAVATVWAKKQPQRGNERFTAAQVTGQMVTMFLIRYRDDVTQANRLEYDGRQWDIFDIRELGRREGLEIDAVARGD